MRKNIIIFEKNVKYFLFSVDINKIIQYSIDIKKNSPVPGRYGSKEKKMTKAEIVKKIETCKTLKELKKLDEETKEAMDNFDFSTFMEIGKMFLNKQLKLI